MRRVATLSKSNRGFTLVDALMAIAILSICGMAAATAIGGAAAASSTSSDEDTAVRIQLQTLERIHEHLPLAAGGSLDPTAPVMGFSSSTSVLPDGAIAPPGTPGSTSFLVLWEIQITTLRKVTIAVFKQQAGMWTAIRRTSRILGENL